MQVFLDTYATEGIRPAIAREVLSSYSEASFTNALMDDGSHIEVAEVKGHLVGFAQVTFGATHELSPAGTLFLPRTTASPPAVRLSGAQ